MEPLNPIVVNDNPLKDQFGTAIRYAIYGAAAFATGLGYTGASEAINDLAAYAGPVGAFLAFVWGQYSSRRNAKIKKTLATQVPDTVAQLK